MAPEINVINIKSIVPYSITVYQHILSPFRVHPAAGSCALNFCRNRKEKLTNIVRNFKVKRPMNQKACFNKDIETRFFTIEYVINRLVT